MRAPLPNNESERLAVLQRYDVLDTEPETAFDDLTELAAQICDTPIALISLVDSDRQWFKSKVGLSATETPRDLAFCAYTILSNTPLVVEDPLNDPRFATNPLVTDEPHIRFYAGVPLMAAPNCHIGSLCVIDRVERHLQPEQIRGLQTLGHQVISQLELRRNLAALQERENQLRAIFDAVPECVKLVDAEGKLLRINPAGLDMIEADDIQAIMNQSIYSLIAPEYRSDYQAFNERVCRGERGMLEFEIIGCRGRRRYVASHAVPLQLEPHQPIVHLGVTQDITARKQTEEKLRQQAERERLMTVITQRIHQSLDLHEILNTTVLEVQKLLQVDRVLTYRTDSDGTGLVLTEAVAPDCPPILGEPLPPDIFPLECHELYRRGRIRVIADIEQDQMSACLADSLRQLGVKSKLVVPILYADQLWGLLIAHQCQQTRHWQSWEVELLEQLATQVAIAIQQSELYQQVQTELTERIRAERTIRDQAALLDVATDAILVRDLDHRITFWNKGAERLYGWTAEEVCGQKVTELLYRDMPDQVEEIYQSVLSAGSWQGELHHYTRAEQEIIVESRWTLVRPANGQPSAILMVNTDITQKKQLEQQFLRTQRMESIGTLAGGIAHDLNNVLAPILMAVPLLEAQLLDPDDPKSRQWLDIVENSTRRGANLVRQVLSFARGVTGERSLLEIKHLIWEIKQVAEETFPKSITFSTNLARDLWAIHGDATQLHQVLMNLCVNARDAMPNGGMLRISAQNVVLEAETAQRYLDAHTGSYLLMTVSDTGTGIPPELLDRIFDPFFTTKEVGKGTGLGLSTVISIVKSHGGFITVKSQVGAGTEFRVYLPAITHGKIQLPTVLDMPDGQGEWILVADDEAAIRETVKTTLETHGYRVYTARNGNEAIALYTQHKQEIRLAIINVMMPALDGATTIRVLKTINPDLKIVATSGISASEQLAKLEITVDYFLLKPFTTQELLLRLHRTLNVKPLS